MVDVGEKEFVNRVATASGFIRLNPATLNLIYDKGIKKGDVLTVAKIAGISAAKKNCRNHTFMPSNSYFAYLYRFSEKTKAYQSLLRLGLMPKQVWKWRRLRQLVLLL